MDDENALTISSYEIDYSIHWKLKRECVVVIEEFNESSLPKWAVAQLRQLSSSTAARRLFDEKQQKSASNVLQPKICLSQKCESKLVMPFMKTGNNEQFDTVPFTKRDSRDASLLADKFQQPMAESMDTTSAEQLGLSDDDILKLFYDVADYIECGVWSSTSDPSEKTIGPNVDGTNLLLSSTINTSDDKSYITSDAEAVRCSVAMEIDSNNRRSALIQTNADIHRPEAVPQSGYDYGGSTSFLKNPATSNGAHNGFYSKMESEEKWNAEKIVKQTDGSMTSVSVRDSIRAVKYDANDCCSVSGDVFDYKRAKRSAETTSDLKPLSRMSLAVGDYSTTVNEILSLNNAKFYDWMKEKVVNVLCTPCITYLEYGSCGTCCPYNHVLPPASVVNAAIDKWSTEMIDFLYTGYVQRYRLCYQMYFEVVCSIYVKRRLSQKLIATVKDCERLHAESHLLTIFVGLVKCGYTYDDALYKMCTNGWRSSNTMNAVMTIMTSLRIAHFKRTMLFLASEMEKIDFKLFFGDEILKQACELDTLDDPLMKFCCGIVKKFHGFLSQSSMQKLLSKIHCSKK